MAILQTRTSSQGTWMACLISSWEGSNVQLQRPCSQHQWSLTYWGAPNPVCLSVLTGWAHQDQGGRYAWPLGIKGSILTIGSTSYITEVKNRGNKQKNFSLGLGSIKSKKRQNCLWPSFRTYRVDVHELLLPDTVNRHRLNEMRCRSTISHATGLTPLVTESFLKLFSISGQALSSLEKLGLTDNYYSSN